MQFLFLFIRNLTLISLLSFIIFDFAKPNVINNIIYTLCVILFTFVSFLYIMLYSVRELTNKCYYTEDLNCFVFKSTAIKICLTRKQKAFRNSATRSKHFYLLRNMRKVLISVIRENSYNAMS